MVLPSHCTEGGSRPGLKGACPRSWSKYVMRQIQRAQELSPKGGFCSLLGRTSNRRQRQVLVASQSVPDPFRPGAAGGRRRGQQGPEGAQGRAPRRLADIIEHLLRTVLQPLTCYRRDLIYPPQQPYEAWTTLILLEGATETQEGWIRGQTHRLTVPRFCQVAGHCPRDASILALSNDAQAPEFPSPSPALGRI